MPRFTRISLPLPHDGFRSALSELLSDLGLLALGPHRTGASKYPETAGRNGITCTASKQQLNASSWYRNIYTLENETLPGWERHLEGSAVCNKQSLDELTNGRWYVTQEGHFLYEPSSCQLLRHTGESARRCFHGKHIVFMGDSLTRYQYIELAYLLSKMHRAEPYGGIKGLPSLSMETEWKDWHQFYHFSSAILGAAADGCAAETCDCQRDKEDALLDMTREYRTFQLSFPHKCQAKRHQGNFSESTKHLTVSYHQVFGRPDPTTAGKEGMKYYTNSFGQQPPDILLFNMGHHAAHLPSGEVYNNTMSAILHSGQEIRQRHNTKLLWKTTTPHRSTASYIHREQELQTLKSFEFMMFDIGKVVSTGLKQGMNFYWDDVHLLPFVYQQFNDILLNHLCV